MLNFLYIASQVKLHPTRTTHLNCFPCPRTSAPRKYFVLSIVEYNRSPSLGCTAVMIRFLSKFRVSVSLCHSADYVPYEWTVLTAQGLSLPGNPIPHTSVNVQISGVHEKVLETDFCLSSNPTWNENSPRFDIHSQRRLLLTSH